MNKPQSYSLAKPDDHTDPNEQSLSREDSVQEGKPAISRKAMKDMISGYLLLNNKLMDKICELQEELEAKNSTELQSSFHQDYSIMNTDFNEIEEHIKQYKLSLTAYQDKVQAQITAKNETIAKLNEEVTTLTSKLEEQSQMIEQLQQKNTALEETKESLLQELQGMEIELRRTQLTSSKISKVSKRNSLAHDDYSYQPIDFSQKVQAELQKLINKLMKELEYEQADKKKLTAQIKRLQQEIIELEKEIIQKNNKIYSLELKAIKSQKSNLNATVTNIRASQRHPTHLHNFSIDHSIQSIDTEKTKRKDAKTANSFTLEEIFNENYSLKLREKLYLSIRLIEAFCEKIRKNDLKTEEGPSIYLQNFNLNEPHQYSVRFTKKTMENSEMEDGSVESVISNLFHLLDQIFRNNKFNKKGAASWMERRVVLLISAAKRNKNLSFEELANLKEALEEMADQGENDQQL